MTAIPARPSPAVMRFFDGYVVRYLRRRFHRVHLWGPRDAVPVPRARPLVYAMSHTSWWDVLVGYHLARAVVGIESYAPMDEAQLARYRVLRRLGLYSVDRGSAAGLRDFLAYTTGLLAPGRAVWITPQGEITSPRRRPLGFQAGIGHLARRVQGLAVVPVAVAYEFVHEPRPEIFVKFGEPCVFDARPVDSGEATRRLEAALERELDAVEVAVVTGDRLPFTTLLDGATSASLVYDRVRAVRRWVSGRPDPARHGDLVSDPRRRAS